MDVASIRLTELSSCAGCAAKLGAAELRSVMERVSPATDDRVLVGYGSSDDAGVYLVRDDLALVSTVDFFTPIVDDPFDFGRIAATNALSDVYAMGGRPISALNIVAFPEDLDLAILAQILEGGATVARSAGVAVLGGHTIKDAEPKYGMAVTGLADPAALLRIDAGQAGLPLSLTKPIGSGVLNSRHKATGEVFPAAIEVMTTLNAAASRAALAAGIRCATDVTGFGLLGHLFKLARASEVTAILDTAAVPLIDGAAAALAAGFVPGGTRRNLDWVAPHADVGGLPAERLLLMADAQTSGGLLLAGEVPGGTVIGELVRRSGPTLVLR